MSADAIAPQVMSFEEARRVVEQHAATVKLAETESLDLLAAAGRVLSEPVVADRDHVCGRSRPRKVHVWLDLPSWFSPRRYHGN